MVQPKPYDRLPEETELNHLAFCCYRDLGVGRTVEAAREVYEEKRGRKRDGGIAKKNGRFQSWALEFNWNERCRAWDLEKEAEKREIQRKVDAKKYVKELEDLRKSQLQLGRIGLANALGANQLLQNFLAEKLRNKEGVISTKEAKTLADIARACSEKSAEQWAQALQIERLLEEISLEP